MAKKSWLGILAAILLIIGGINWGLTLFNVNLVTIVFGTLPLLVKVIYSLVGLSAVYYIYELVA